MEVLMIKINIIGNGTGELSSNSDYLNEAVRISHGANTLVKDMNPTVLSQAMGNDYTELFTLCMALALGEGKLRFKPLKLCLKNWPCDASCSCGGVK